MTHSLVQADAIRLPFADRTFSLTIGSPPYCDARTYGIGAQRNAHQWVEWMLAVTTEALRVTDGPVIWVAAGVTRDRTYWPACEGLMWEWYKRGGSAYRPCYWHRVGIPGSGGDQWYRADVEYVMCFKRPGPLPWAEPTANGHAPKWAPGGEMSHRLSDGKRRNQWGGCSVSPHERKANGERQPSSRPSHRMHTKRDARGQIQEQSYDPPVLANPGNVVRSIVGGGALGHELAHESEAPYPEAVPRFFIRSHCPPDGIVLDPFGGSGTTGAAAVLEGRRFVLCDIRSGVGALDTARRRLANADRYGIKDNPALANPSARLAPMPGQQSLFDSA